MMSHGFNQSTEETAILWAKRSLYTLGLLALLARPAIAADRWNELDPDLRKDLSQFLDNPDTFEVAQKTPQFQDWWHRYYCKDPSPFAEKCPTPRSVYAAYRFNHEFSIGERVTLACTFQTLQTEFKGRGLPIPTSLGRILSSNSDGHNIVFTPNPSDPQGSDFKKALASFGFTTDFNADGLSRRWGLRSSKKGTALHCYTREWDSIDKTKIYCHIDLFNPGKYLNGRGIKEKFYCDLENIKTGSSHTYIDLILHFQRTSAALLNAMGTGCGLGKEDLSEMMLNEYSRLPTGTKQSGSAQQTQSIDKVLAPKTAAPDTQNGSTSGFGNAAK